MMTDQDFRAELTKIARTYPSWMGQANFALVQDFRRIVEKAAALAKKMPARSVEDWRVSAGCLIRDYRDLEFNARHGNAA